MRELEQPLGYGVINITPISLRQTTNSKVDNVVLSIPLCFGNRHAGLRTEGSPETIVSDNDSERANLGECFTFIRREIPQPAGLVGLGDGNERRECSDSKCEENGQSNFVSH